MKIFFSSRAASSFLKKGSAVTMGNFDGVHLGHRAILKELKKEAKKKGIPAVLYTFEPHPVKVLAPSVAPPLLNTLEQKIELLGECGLDAAVFEKFNWAYAKHSAEDFFMKFLRQRLKARLVNVGYDFTFGSKRQGNIETLEHLCNAHHVQVKIIPPFLYGDTLVSSSLVRKYVAEGKVREALPLLGRPYFIDGCVTRGKGRGGRAGIPTANIKSANELIPRRGVYATKVRRGKKLYDGVTNIGTNPTFGGQLLSIETHLLGFKRKIYGEKIRIYFVKRLRDEVFFSSSEKLVAQIRQDIAKARKILRALPT